MKEIKTYEDAMSLCKSFGLIPVPSKAFVTAYALQRAYESGKKDGGS